MNKKEQIKKEIQDWIESNRSHFPLNADSWQIHIASKNKYHDKPVKLVELGSYHAKITSSDPFYKPYSKTFIL